MTMWILKLIISNQKENFLLYIIYFSLGDSIFLIKEYSSENHVLCRLGGISSMFHAQAVLRWKYQTSETEEWVTAPHTTL